MNHLAQWSRPMQACPTDLASVTAFLLSDESEWINGQVWYIGGAAHMRQ